MIDTDKIAHIRKMATNIIGFHALTENEDAPLTSVQRIQYEAIVAGSAVPLALAIYDFFESLDEEGPHHGRRKCD